MDDTPPMTILGLDHVVLRAADPARMIAFYCQVLGLTVEKVQAEIGLTQLRGGRTLIDIVDVAGTLGRPGGPAPGPTGRNMDHLCLQVTPFDGARIRAHLIGHGASPSDVVSRFGAQGEGPSIYVDDPEGNTVELKGARAD